jgi:hypothetical protein
MAYNNYYKVTKGFSLPRGESCIPGWNELACEYVDVKTGSEMPPRGITDVEIKRLIEANRTSEGGLVPWAKSMRFYSNNPDKILAVFKNVCRCFSTQDKTQGFITPCTVLGCHCKIIIGPNTRCLSDADVKRLQNFQVCSAGMTVFKKNNQPVDPYSPGCMCRQCYDIQSIVEVGDPVTSYGNFSDYKTRRPIKVILADGEEYKTPYRITSRRGTKSALRLIEAKETAVKVITGKYYDRRSKYNSFEFEEQIDSSSKIQADYELTHTMTYSDLIRLSGENTNINPLIGASNNWEGEMAKITLSEAANIVVSHVKKLPLPDGWIATEIWYGEKLENLSEGKTVELWRHPVSNALGGVKIKYVKTPVTFKADEDYSITLPEKLIKKYPHIIMKTLAGFRNITHV